MKILPRGQHNEIGYIEPRWLRWAWKIATPVFTFLTWKMFVYDGPEGMYWDEGHFCWPWKSSRRKLLREYRCR